MVEDRDCLPAAGSGRKWNRMVLVAWHCCWAV